MMQITHMASGAAIGSFMPNPLLAFLAGFLIHFVIDKIPHFWPKSKKNKTLQVVIDHTFTYFIFLGLLIFEIGTPNIWAGIFGSLLVDVLFTVPFIFKSAIGRWHRARQPHSTKPKLLITDGFVTVIGAIALRFF